VGKFFPVGGRGGGDGNQQLGLGGGSNKRQNLLGGKTGR
jgi:hypothetical protein